MMATAIAQTPPAASPPVAVETPEERIVVIRWVEGRLWCSIVMATGQQDSLLWSPSATDKTVKRIEVNGYAESARGWE